MSLGSEAPRGRAAALWSTDSYLPLLVIFQTESMLRCTMHVGAKMISIRAKEDGTYTVYRDNAILVTGLSRDQANAVAQSLKATIGH
ncbi:hypothetical protein MFUR16E_06735 [Methylobacterium fujisawaense]